MSRLPSRARLIALGSLFVLLLAGCGKSGKTVTVTGKLVLPQKAKLAESDSVIVTFLPEDNPTAPGGTANVNPKDLTFSLAVPPGKYKVSVTFQPYPGEKDSEQRTKELNQHVGMFSRDATALRHEVGSEPNQAITIDLVKSTITKN
jgi:hypothetical protein